MNEPEEQVRARTLEERRDDRGYTWRGVSLSEDGSLAIEGQDLGKIPEGFWGEYEYEFSRTLSPAETATLRGLLHVPDGGDLVAVLAERFTTSSTIEAFVVQEHGIPGQFWSRVGD